MKLGLIAVTAVGGLLGLWQNIAETSAETRISVPAIVVPALAGKVDGHSENSDEYIWNVFVDVVKQAPDGKVPEFATWATDSDIYRANPRWPRSGAPIKFQASKQGRNHVPALAGVPCATPENPYVSNFPPKGCIAEGVYRNRVQYNYIVNNGLYSRGGVAAFYKSGKEVAMPAKSIAVKADWVPVKDIVKWIPELTLGDVRKHYYTIVSDQVEYGLVALHLSTAQNPNWVWGTFEQRNNPGRCDAIGCIDSFGAIKPVVMPDYTKPNTQYGACHKTPELLSVMNAAGLGAVWRNYCLKSTQVDFVDDNGVPTVMTNSVTERIPFNGELIGSCISCHSYASFGPDGEPTDAANAMMVSNPVGKPILSSIKGSHEYDFMWGILNLYSGD